MRRALARELGRQLHVPCRVAWSAWYAIARAQPQTRVGIALANGISNGYAGWRIVFDKQAYQPPETIGMMCFVSFIYLRAKDAPGVEKRKATGLG